MSTEFKAEKVCLINLGCHKNLVDAETILGALDDAGFVVTNDPVKAEIVMVNTCGFLEAAREESAEILLDMASLRRQGDIQWLAVTGCMADRDRLWLKERIPEIDQFVSSFQLDEIPRLIRYRQQDLPMLKSADFQWSMSPRWLSTPPSYAFIKIADGCGNKCAYCRIPYLRGELRSKPVDDILEEASAIIESGRREIILISQDSTSYGQDIRGAFGFTELVKEISLLPELRRLRLMYLYPSRTDRNLLILMRETPAICDYLDIPLQHVNQRVLKAMNRSLPGFKGESGSYTERYLREIREIVPDITIRTTLMTGFPGEDQKAYEELEALVDSELVDHLGVFAWSPEPDTPSWSLKDQWDRQIGEDRAARLYEIQAGYVEARNVRKLGKRVEIVIDEVEEDHQGVCWSVGRMVSQAPEVDGVVRVVGAHEPGEYLSVTLDSVDIYDFSAII